MDLYELWHSNPGSFPPPITLILLDLNFEFSFIMKKEVIRLVENLSK
ncbi:hypothetical protein B566_EDAN004157 [Ephemera danica]|nr:hypothetical protein B566_EDAN004157 [Ephemera danica]